MQSVSASENSVSRNASASIVATLGNVSTHQIDSTCSAQQDSARLMHLLSVMPAGVLVIDHKGKVSLANEQANKLFGEPLVGELWRDIIARAFAPKADDGHEVSMKSGRRVKIDISPLIEEKGQLIVVTDLTETRELQSRVGHMQRLSSLGKMVASLAHQVRTPLSSALLYAENLKSMPLNNDIADRFTNKLTLRLKELESQVNDMLLFAKSSDKQIVAPINVQDLVNAAVAQLDMQFKNANINLSIKIVPLAKQQSLLGNMTALSGALANLLSNAIQALSATECADLMARTGQQAKIEFTVEQRVHEQQECLSFTVKDNGPGIDQADINKILEPFYTTKSQGTGLGLAVVSTVAKSHKGHLLCGNNPHSGAYFSLLLPSIAPTNNQQIKLDHSSNQLLSA